MTGEPVPTSRKTEEYTIVTNLYEGAQQIGAVVKLSHGGRTFCIAFARNWYGSPDRYSPLVAKVCDRHSDAVDEIVHRAESAREWATNRNPLPAKETTAERTAD